MRRTLILTAVGAAVACGPVTSTSVLIDAAAEVAAARTARAEHVAPYELTAAELYLQKAREEQGYAEFELATELARKSLACARAALAVVDSRARLEATATASDAMSKTGRLHAPGVEPIPDSECRPGRLARPEASTARQAQPGLQPDTSKNEATWVVPEDQPPTSSPSAPPANDGQPPPPADAPSSPPAAVDEPTPTEAEPARPDTTEPQAAEPQATEPQVTGTRAE